MSEQDTVKQLKIHRTRIDALAESVECLEHKIESLERELDTIRDEREMLLGKLASSDDNALAGLSPAERVLIDGWDTVSTKRTKNRERAVSVVEQWDDISRNVRSDDLLKSMKQKNLVNKVDCIDNFTTAARVMKYVQKTTNGKIVYREDDGVIVQKEELITDIDDI
jgi:hypothetical protein